MLDNGGVHGPAGSRMPAPAVFLGALASEVNEPDELAPAFATVADITERIVGAVRSGRLAEQLAAQYLQPLRLTDPDGGQWAVGATSLRWYRRTPERGWKLAVPPSQEAESHQGALERMLADLPAELLTEITPSIPDVAALAASGYGADPFASLVVAAPSPWEYEMGDDRRLTYGEDVAPPSY